MRGAAGDDRSGDPAAVSLPEVEKVRTISVEIHGQCAAAGSYDGSGSDGERICGSIPEIAVRELAVLVGAARG